MRQKRQKRQMRQKRTTIRERYDTRPTRRGARAAEPSHPRLTLNSCNFLTISPDLGILFRDFCSIPESFVSLKTDRPNLVDSSILSLTSCNQEMLSCTCYKSDQCTIINLIDLILTACLPIDSEYYFSMLYSTWKWQKASGLTLFLPFGGKQIEWNLLKLGSSCTIGKCSTRYTIMAINDRAITVTLAKYSFLGQAPLSMYHLKNIFLMIHAIGIGFEIPIFGTNMAKS